MCRLAANLGRQGPDVGAGGQLPERVEQSVDFLQIQLEVDFQVVLLGFVVGDVSFVLCSDYRIRLDVLTRLIWPS